MRFAPGKGPDHQVPVSREVCMQDVVGVECTGKGVESTVCLDSPSTPMLQPSHTYGDMLAATTSIPEITSAAL
eukprot:1146070-Pelagomonas_calceolata.AAC.7